MEGKAAHVKRQRCTVPQQLFWTAMTGKKGQVAVVQLDKTAPKLS